MFYVNKDPLYAFTTLDPAGNMEIKGVKSEWVSPSPFDVGVPKGILESELTAEISDYSLKF